MKDKYILGSRSYLEAFFKMIADAPDLPSNVTEDNYNVSGVVKLPNVSFNSKGPNTEVTLSSKPGMGLPTIKVRYRRIYVSELLRDGRNFTRGNFPDPELFLVLQNKSPQKIELTKTIAEQEPVNQELAKEFVSRLRAISGLSLFDVTDFNLLTPLGVTGTVQDSIIFSGVTSGQEDNRWSIKPAENNLIYFPSHYSFSFTVKISRGINVNMIDLNDSSITITGTECTQKLLVGNTSEIVKIMNDSAFSNHDGSNTIVTFGINSLDVRRQRRLLSLFQEIDLRFNTNPASAANPYSITSSWWYYGKKNTPSVVLTDNVRNVGTLRDLENKGYEGWMSVNTPTEASNGYIFLITNKGNPNV